MDFGLDKFIEMFEARFGRRPTTAFLVLIGVGIASGMIRLTWDNLVRPLYHFAQDMNLAGITGSVSGSFWSNLENLGASIFFTVVIINCVLVTIYCIFGFWKSVIGNFFEERRRKIWWDKQHAEFLAKYPPASPLPSPALSTPPEKTTQQTPPSPTSP